MLQGQKEIAREEDRQKVEDEKDRTEDQILPSGQSASQEHVTRLNPTACREPHRLVGEWRFSTDTFLESHRPPAA